MSKKLKPVAFYKRFNSITEIDNVEIPAVQRLLIKSHVDELKEHVIDSYEKSKEPIFGTLDLAYYRHKYWVVDGMHRLACLKELYVEKNIIVPINALVYYISLDTELEEIFTIRNKSIPIASFLLSMNEKKKELLKYVTAFLEQNFKNVFRHDRILRPYIHINSFLENFRKSKLYDIINDEKEFVDVFNALNQYCFEKVYGMEEKEKKRYGISKTMIDLWNKDGVFVGYDKNYEIFSEKFDITPYKKYVK